jgi:hypothetical protein
MDMNDLMRINRTGYTMDAYGQAIGAGGELLHGMQYRDAAHFQAEQLRRNATDQVGIATLKAAEADRHTALQNSRALAVAAASGGGASDPGVVSLLARNAEEGAYRRQIAMYEGASASRGMNLAAAAREYEGKAGQVNATENAVGSLFGATTTLLKGQARDSLFAKYGMGSPANGNAS